MSDDHRAPLDMILSENGREKARAYQDLVHFQRHGYAAKQAGDGPASEAAYRLGEHAIRKFFDAHARGRR